MVQTSARENRATTREYELFLLRRFFECVVSGRLEEENIHEQASELGLDLNAGAYTIAFVSIPPEGREGELRQDKIREALVSHFMKYPEYIPIHWDFRTIAVIIKGDRENIDPIILRCTEKVREHYLPLPEARWHIAVGSPVESLGELPLCFDELSRLWAYRHISPSQHILLPGSAYLASAESETDISEPDIKKLSPERIISFLKSSDSSKAAEFADEYIRSFGEALRSPAFCQYLMLNLRFTAMDFLRFLQVPQEKFSTSLKYSDCTNRTLNSEELKLYAQDIFISALELRDIATGRNSSPLMSSILACIEANYLKSELSLSYVAAEIGVSPNYLSAVFSREMDTTFIEYVTYKRMAKARELLAYGSMGSGEVAAAVGYRDCHYFSSLFKKTQGCSPREYRARKTIK